jgi:diacylglycerol O-acyltransferase / wax synthase
VTAERLSALDASFLAVERPDAPMHVGWVALFDPPGRGPRPRFAELFEHVSGRLERAPRYRQRLAGVPLGLHDPVWVDDPEFEPSDHLFAAHGDLDALAADVFSTPLERDRPLWEMWLHDDAPGGGIAIVGKAHHCMVDGIAAMQLANLLLDREATPDGRGDLAGAPPRSSPAPAERLVSAVADRTADTAALALAPMRLAASPSRLLGLPRSTAHAARTLAHAVLPPAPSSPLNRAGGGARRLVRLVRPLDDLRTVRKRFGVTPNDVVLAACAGALRRFQERRGEAPRRLKAMVPADVRSAADAAGSGNRISFLFLALPCDEPEPVARLQAVNRATAQRDRDGEADDVDIALRTLARTPRPLQRALANAVAHPRLFNLVVSSIPGPAVPRYLRGCRLRELYPAVPLAGRHGVSIGVLTVAGRACFGLYADPEILPDADALAHDLDEAVEELLKE